MNPEWKVIDGKYYTWPLYTGQDESVDKTMNFIHNFIDGTIHTPLINEFLNKMDDLKELTTVLVCNDLLPDDGYNGFLSMEGKCDDITLNNTVLLCCRGFVRTCNCNQNLGKKTNGCLRNKKTCHQKIPHSYAHGLTPPTNQQTKINCFPF